VATDEVLDEVLTARDGAVTTITINRPIQRNALSPNVSRGLRRALAAARQDDATRVVVLRGAGDRAFCAGADLASFAVEQSEIERHHGRHGFVELFLLMQDLGKPILGRVNGHALAGGFGLACSCDLLLAVETATFGTP